MQTHYTIRNAFRNPWLWAAFLLFTTLLGYTMINHELWGDEMHAWNIAKASNGLMDVIHNTRYEGHPPAWHALLWMASLVTKNIMIVKLLQWCIAVMVVFVVLFYSPFPFLARVLIPFGYFFLFEYGILGRNYAIAVLPVFCICLIMRQHFRYKVPLYYALLFLMTNTHLLVLPLAAGLHLYFLWWNVEQKNKRHIILLHALAGLLTVLPALYFIFPPTDSQIDMNFWMKQWTPQYVALFTKSPAWAFLPMPAWWKQHFWNTHFMMTSGNVVIIKVVTPLVSAAILWWIYVLLRKSKKSLAIFVTSFVLTALIAVFIFGLSSTRYVGFLYISFLAAWWMYSYEWPVSKKNERLLNLLLLLQMVAGIFSVTQDIRLPFSNAYRVNELLNKVPAGEKTVTDYWALNAVSAYAQKKLYCVDIKREATFVSWGSDIPTIKSDPNHYTNGIAHYFDISHVDKVYMISAADPVLLGKRDAKLSVQYNLILTDKIEGAIDPGGNLYLYIVAKKNEL